MNNWPSFVVDDIYPYQHFTVNIVLAHGLSGEGCLRQLGEVLMNVGRSKSCGLFDEPMANGKSDGFGAAGHLQFGQDVTDMGFDSRGFDKQFGGNLGII